MADTANDVSASSGSSPQQAVNSMSNDLFDGNLSKISCISIFSFFWFSNILSDALLLTVSQLQTQQVMTSQIRPHIGYLIQSCCIFVGYSFYSQNL